MKFKQNNKFTLSGLRTAACKVWGARLAEKMVQLAINSRLVVLPKLRHGLIPSAKGKARMNKTNGPVDQIRIGLGVALLAVLTGCVGGYVGVDGGYYGGVVVVDPLFVGGVYDRGGEVHGYSHRGAVSRAVAHPGGRGGRGGGGKR
jgi:hypothetical protein